MRGGSRSADVGDRLSAPMPARIAALGDPELRLGFRPGPPEVAGAGAQAGSWRPVVPSAFIT